MMEEADMPNPLSRVCSHANIIFEAYPLERNPELLTLAMRIISTWSTLESTVDGCFGAIIGGNAKAAAAIWKTLRSRPAEQTAFRAAAGATQNERYKELTEVLLELLKKAAKTRDIVAHWVWAYTPEVPDAILLMSPEDYFEYNIQFQSNIEQLVTGERNAPIKNPALPKDQIFVYRARDFNEAIERIQRLNYFFHLYRVSLSAPAYAIDGLYNRLCNEPEIATALIRHRKARNAKEAPQQQPEQQPAPPEK